MSDESTALAVSGSVENIFLAARNTEEMANSQTRLAEWLRAKIVACNASATELRKATEHARKMKWQSKSIRAAFNREMQRVIYYEKLMKAVESGYVLIPWNWMDTFAVRVSRPKPRSEFANGSDFQSAINHLPSAKGENLEAGSGRYVGDSVMGNATRVTEEKDGKQIAKYSAWPTDFTEVEFPLAAARPELMNATAQAMALKIFDEIGVSPNRRGKDPLILGMIQGPQYTKQYFLIAWYLDTRAL